MRGLVECVVEVVALSVSLLDGSESSSLNTRALEPWLTHLEAFLGVSAEEGVVNSELVELDKEVILRHSFVAWNIVTSEGDTGDTEGEELVHRELNI